jgi:hypothetical protein
MLMPTSESGKKEMMSEFLYAIGDTSKRRVTSTSLTPQELSANEQFPSVNHAVEWRAS